MCIEQEQESPYRMNDCSIDILFWLGGPPGRRGKRKKGKPRDWREVAWGITGSMNDDVRLAFRHLLGNSPGTISTSHNVSCAMYVNIHCHAEAQNVKVGGD